MGTKFDALVRGLSESVSSRIWDEICALVRRFEDLFVRLENLECYSKKN